MFIFSISEELQRAFGKAGFLWCLVESDITQSELLLAKAERYQAKRVSLLASNGIFGERSNGIEGIAGVSDPTSGFDVSYQANFGEKPSLGESALYDAVMVACFASRYAKIHNVDMNSAIASLLNRESQGKGMWTAGSMSHIFDSIERGKTPAFSGASGNLDFSTEHYTTVMYSSYAHWMAYEGRFIHMDYDNRSENHSYSAYAAWEWNKQFSQRFEDSEPGILYPTLNGHWAVIVAASEG